MGIDLRRVVEVYSPGLKRVGSGYLLTADLVITAGHVVGQDLGVQVEVRPLGVMDWLRATVGWYGARQDVAVVRVNAGSERSGLPPVTWGQIQGTEAVPCAAIGFPWAQA